MADKTKLWHLHNISIFEGMPESAMNTLDRMAAMAAALFFGIGVVVSVLGIKDLRHLLGTSRRSSQESDRRSA